MVSSRRGELLAALALALTAVPLGARADGEPWRLAAAIEAPRWLSFGATHRVRYEHLFESPRTGEEAGALSLRTTAGGELRADGFAVGVELIDARIHPTVDATPLDTSLVDALDILRAYVRIEAEDVGAPRVRLVAQAGRLTLDVGSRRLVARNRFRNTINAFSGVDLAWTSAAGDAVRLFAVVPVGRLPSDREGLLENAPALDLEIPGAILWGVHVSPRAFDGDVRLEVYAIGLHESDAVDRATRDRRYVTPGARVLRPAGRDRVDFEVEATGQLGAVRASADPDAADLDHVAFFVHAAAGYSFDLAVPLRAAVLLDYASGDADPEDGVDGRFDTLYGARRFELGPTGLYGLFARSNLFGPGIVLQLRPHPLVDLSLGYRPFWLAEPRDAWTGVGLRDATGATDAFVGHLIEARARFRVEGNVGLELGYAQLVRGGFAPGAPGAFTGGDPIHLYAEASFEL